MHFTNTVRVTDSATQTVEKGPIFDEKKSGVTEWKKKKLVFAILLSQDNLVRK